MLLEYAKGEETAEQVSELFKALLTTLDDRHCEIVAAVINRVPAGAIEELHATDTDRDRYL